MTNHANYLGSKEVSFDLGDFGAEFAHFDLKVSFRLQKGAACLFQQKHLVLYGVMDLHHLVGIRLKN